MWPGDTPYMGIFALELLFLRLGAADLKLPSWSILNFPVHASDNPKENTWVETGKAGGHTASSSSFTPLPLQSQPVSWAASLLTSSFAPFCSSPFMHHSSFSNKWWDGDSLTWSSLMKHIGLPSVACRLSVPSARQAQREFLLCSHHQGAVREKNAVYFSWKYWVWWFGSMIVKSPYG